MNHALGRRWKKDFSSNFAVPSLPSLRFPRHGGERPRAAGSSLCRRDGTDASRHATGAGTRRESRPLGEALLAPRVAVGPTPTGGGGTPRQRLPARGACHCAGGGSSTGAGAARPPADTAVAARRGAASASSCWRRSAVCGGGPLRPAPTGQPGVVRRLRRQPRHGRRCLL